MSLPRSATSSGPEMKLMLGVEAWQEAVSRLSKMISDEALMALGRERVRVLAECCDGSGIVVLVVLPLQSLHSARPPQLSGHQTGAATSWQRQQPTTADNNSVLPLSWLQQTTKYLNLISKIYHKYFNKKSSLVVVNRKPCVGWLSPTLAEN